MFRLVLTLEGETIVDAAPVMGYLHRGTEKIMEEGTYLQNVTLTDRLDYLAGMSNNLAYSLAVENMAGIEVPLRGEYLRVLFMELQRYASHCVAIGTFGADVGAFFTPLLYTFREREAILDLFEFACGARMTFTFIRPGGAALELPDEFFPVCQRLLDTLPRQVDEYEALLTGNEIFLARTKDVGVLPAEKAISYAVSGPVLRASGVPYDLRRAVPYCAYPEFDFDVITRTEGDCFARYLVRIAEMRESIKICQQALKKVVETPGPVRHPAVAVLPAAAGRGVQPDRGAARRARLLRRLGRRDRAVPGQLPAAVVHQHRPARLDADRLEGGRRDRDPRLDRHRPGGSRPLSAVLGLLILLGADRRDDAVPDPAAVRQQLPVRADPRRRSSGC